MHSKTNCKAPVKSVHLIFDALDDHNHFFSFAAFEDTKDTNESREQETMKVFLQIRPFVPNKISISKDQGICYW